MAFYVCVFNYLSTQIWTHVYFWISPDSGTGCVWQRARKCEGGKQYQKSFGTDYTQEVQVDATVDFFSFSTLSNLHSRRKKTFPTGYYYTHTNTHAHTSIANKLIIIHYSSIYFIFFFSIPNYLMSACVYIIYSIRIVFIVEHIVLFFYSIRGTIHVCTCTQLSVFFFQMQYKYFIM